MDDDQLPEIPVKRRPGRPKGSKNRTAWRVTPELPRAEPEGQKPFADYKAADPLTLTSALYAEVEWNLRALRNQRVRFSQSKQLSDKAIAAGERVDANAVEDLGKTASTLERAMKAHEKALSLAEKLSKLKTPEETLQHAISKIKAQDLPTLRTIIRDLKKYLLAQAPLDTHAAQQAGSASAASFIQELEDESR